MKYLTTLCYSQTKKMYIAEKQTFESYHGPNYLQKLYKQQMYIQYFMGFYRPRGEKLEVFIFNIILRYVGQTENVHGTRCNIADKDLCVRGSLKSSSAACQLFKALALAVPCTLIGISLLFVFVT